MATLIYLLSTCPLDESVQDGEDVIDEDITDRSRLHLACSPMSLAKDAKDVVTCVALQPALPDMSTWCLIGRKGTLFTYRQV